MVNKSKNVISSFKYAFQGMFSALKTERNLKIHVTIMILVIIFGILLKILIIFICFLAYFRLVDNNYMFMPTKINFYCSSPLTKDFCAVNN